MPRAHQAIIRMISFSKREDTVISAGGVGSEGGFLPLFVSLIRTL